MAESIPAAVEVLTGRTGARRVLRRRVVGHPGGRPALQPGAVRVRVFFLPDVDAAAARLAGLLRPGGTFAVTTWRQGSADDVVGPLVQALTERAGRTPDRPEAARRAVRVDTDGKLAGWLSGLGLLGVDVRLVERDVPLTPDSAWKFVMGSGIRAALDGLDAPVVAAVEARYHELIASTTALRARALVGVGTRDA